MRWCVWLLPTIVLMLPPNDALAQSCERDGCSVFSPCCEGHYCSVREGLKCMPKRQPGEQCGPDAHCLEGFKCMPTLTTAPTCVSDDIDTTQDRVCRLLWSPIVAGTAAESGQALAFSYGGTASALVGASVELGVAYGASGEFGCFATVCGGITSDISVGVFAGISRYNSYADIQGLSVLVGGGASTHRPTVVSETTVSRRPRLARPQHDLLTGRMLGSSAVGG